MAVIRKLYEVSRSFIIRVEGHIVMDPHGEGDLDRGLIYLPAEVRKRKIVLEPVEV